MREKKERNFSNTKKSAKIFIKASVLFQKKALKSIKQNYDKIFNKSKIRMPALLTKKKIN